ncbi:TRAP transporter substrate-binding protein [Clostridium sp. E02]|uniref:TRAP transporter substrate-binding protein n=1 Tax=Clostridium sp. E02 TaxID=2487134 RepID=UPI000F51DB84|nr:TRAP transporter substrate-binding protein [Clostridium sp. E02]
MRKNRLGHVLLIAFAMILSGCGSIKQTGDQITSNVYTETPEYVFTYAENQAEDYPTTQGAYKFAELVQEKTNGRIRINVQAGGVLGDEKSVCEQLQFGGIDFMRMSLSLLAEFVPKLNVLQLPYLYRDAGHMWQVLDGSIGEDFINSFEGSNLIALSWYDAGARNFYNSRHSIHKLEDMKGLNIRVQESDMIINMVEALGANPVPMNYSEVYQGLQTGEIDGAENNWPSYESTSHYEVAKYFTVDEHNRVPELQLCAQSTWDQLGGEDQKIIKECALESADYERKLWSEREKESKEKVRAGGCQITELSPEEKIKFQDAVKPMYNKYCGDYMDIVDAIINTGK